MKHGITIKCTVDYDLFGTNLKNKEGVLINTYPEREKYLVWFSCNQEYAELSEDQFQIASDKVTKQNKDLISRIRSL